MGVGNGRKLFCFILIHEREHIYILEVRIQTQVSFIHPFGRRRKRRTRRRRMRENYKTKPKTVENEIKGINMERIH